MSLQLIYRFCSSIRSRSVRCAAMTSSWCQLTIPIVAIACQQILVAPAHADNPGATAPAALKTILTKIDAAASSRQLPELLKYYSPNFSTSDGLTKATWQQSLGQFWQSYNDVRYATTLERWQTEGNSYIANTTTKITGTQRLNGRVMNLQAVLQSQQKIVGGQIVQQQILKERTQISSGSQPPTIDLTLPDKLQANSEYSLDAIVREPLGEDVLMGATVEQPISAQTYGQLADYKLELLTAGGLFKVANAPGKSGDYWFSTVFIRPSGMTTLTQRVRVVRSK